MNKNTKIALGAAGLVVVTLLAAPMISANIWKSSALSTNNQAIEVINDTAAKTNEFNAKADATSADFDVLIEAYKNEQAAMKDARSKSENVGGINLIDITGSYSKATETSDKLTAIYDELIKFNAAQLASTEAEKQVVAAFEQSASATADADGIASQAQTIRAAGAKYQEYVDANPDKPVEAAFAATLVKLADSFDSSAAALRSNDLGQLTAADAELQAVLTELDSLQADIDAQYGVDQESLEDIINRLNAAVAELE